MSIPSIAGAGLPDIAGLLSTSGMQDPQSDGLMGLASGLLAAGGPSKMPIGFGQALANGMDQFSKQQQQALAMNHALQQNKLAQIQAAQQIQNNALVQQALMQRLAPPAVAAGPAPQPPGAGAPPAAAGSGQPGAQPGSFAVPNPNANAYPQATQANPQSDMAGALALQAKANAMQAANITTPQQQAQFEGIWQQNMDPRIYQLKLMDQQQQQSYLTAMQKNDPQGYAALTGKMAALKQMGAL